jgi:hypothetical protein
MILDAEENDVGMNLERIAYNFGGFCLQKICDDFCLKRIKPKEVSSDGPWQHGVSLRTHLWRKTLGFRDEESCKESSGS